MKEERGEEERECIKEGEREGDGRNGKGVKEERGEEGRECVKGGEREGEGRKGIFLMKRLPSSWSIELAHFLNVIY